MKTNYQTVDENGNIWNINTASGEQFMIHAESDKLAEKSREQIKAFAAARKAAIVAFEMKYASNN